MAIDTQSNISFHRSAEYLTQLSEFLLLGRKASGSQFNWCLLVSFHAIGRANHMQDSIREYGFIYYEEVVSPDGSVKVIYGYNDEEKTPITVEPRIIEVSTGEVLVDLWRAWCQGAVEFIGPGKLRIKVHDVYRSVFEVASAPRTHPQPRGGTDFMTPRVWFSHSL